MTNSDPQINSSYNLISIISLGCLITLFAALYFPIRGDEPYTMVTTAKGVIYALKKSVKFELQPPLYFVVLSIWRIASISLFWARLFSIICYALSIYVGHNLLKKVSHRSNPFLFTALLAFNPIIIYMGSYARLYALLILEILSLLFLFHSLYIDERPSRWKRFAFIVLSVIGLYTQYFVGIFLFAAGISLLILSNHKVLKRYVFDMIIPVVSLTFIIPYISYQIENSVGQICISGSILKILYFIGQRYEVYLLPVGKLPLNEISRWCIRALIVLLIIMSLSTENSKRRLSGKLKYIYLIITIIISLLFGLMFNMIGKSNLMEKHTLILLIPLILIFIGYYSQIQNKYIKIIWVLLFMSIYSIKIGQDFYNPDNISLKKISHFIENNEGKHQPIMLYNYRLHLEMPYFYSGINKLVELPHSIDFSKPYNVSYWAFHNRVQIEISLNKVASYDTLWFVSNNPHNWYGVDYNSSLLDSCINNHYTINKKLCVKYYKVEKLIKRSNNVAHAE